ncbi:MAG: diguanylate cyclase [Thermoanaerobaculia bacterium]
MAILTISLIALAAVVASVVSMHVRRLQRRVDELTLLAEMSDLLQLSATVEEAAAVVSAFGARLFPRCDGALYLAGLTPESLAMASAWGEPCDVLAFAPSDCWALRRAQPHISGTIACLHREAGAPTFCTPIAGGGDVLGVFVLRGDRLPDRRTAALARRTAAQVARVVASLHVHDTLRMHAVRDELTGLYNRRYLQSALARELQRPASRTGLIVADVDGFKFFNDTWGHPAGDALLQHLARMMQRVLREDDVVCRYGGEEFVILVPGATLEQLRSTAERLRQETSQLHVRHEGRPLARITISAGIALAPFHGHSAEELIAAADRALYIAKTQGRDRVELPSQPDAGLDAA